MAILGPQGTGGRFLKAVAVLKAKGKTDLQSRRIVSQRNQSRNST